MNAIARIVGVLAVLGAGADFNDDAPPGRLDFSGRTCLALVGFSEARDQSDAGIAAAMQVVVNRATDPLHRWPRTLCDVALEPGQFLGVDQWPTPRHPERIDAASWQRVLDLADLVIADRAPVPIECAHATGFDQSPLRRDDIRFACRIGAHTFYTDPPPLTAAN